MEGEGKLSQGLTETHTHGGGALALPERSGFDTYQTALGQGCEREGSEKKGGGKVSSSRRAQWMVT